MEGQLPFLQNFTIQQKYSISSKTAVLTLEPYQNKLFWNLLQFRVLHIKSALKLEKSKSDSKCDVKRNRKHIDNIKLILIMHKKENIKMLQNMTYLKNRKMFMCILKMILFSKSNL